MAINKVVYNENGTEKTLIDLSSDTVTADKLINGITAHDKSGNVVTGTINEQTSLDISEDGSDLKLLIPANSYYKSAATNYVETLKNATLKIETTLDSDNSCLKVTSAKLSGLSTSTSHYLTQLLYCGNYIDIDLDGFVILLSQGVQGIEVNGNQVQLYRTGTSEPSNSLGNNGDIYLVTE